MSMENTEEIPLESFLTENNLASYLGAFIDTGYDDPNPLSNKVEVYDKITMELYESCYGLMSSLQFKDYVLAHRIKRLKLKTMVEQSILRANKLFDEQNKDGIAMNFSKLSKDFKDCNPGDVKRAENIKELIEQRLNNLIATREEIESSPSKLFDEKSNVRIWKANELAFHEIFIKELEGTIQTMNATHTKVSENCLNLKRKFPHCLAAAAEVKR